VFSAQGGVSAPLPADRHGASGYVGIDRRGPLRPGHRPDGRPFVLAILVLAVGAAATAGSKSQGAGLPGFGDVSEFHLVLASGASVLAGVFGVLCLLRWRLVGETTPLRVGTATVVLAAGSMLGGDVLAALTSSPAAAQVLGAVQLAAVVFALWLLAVAVTVPPLDTVLRPRPLVGRIAVVMTGAALVGIPGWPPGPPARLGILVAPATATDVAVRLAAAAACAALAVAYTRVGLRHGRWMLTWLGLGLCALALANGFSALARAGDDLWLTAAAGFQFLGMLFAINGGGQDLRRAWAEREAALYATQLRLAVGEAQRQAERAHHEERAHDARSAVTAVHGAVLALEESSDELDRASRSALARALGDELRRLQRLVETTPEDEIVAPYDVGSTLEPIINCRRLAGTDITVDVPDGLFVLGRRHDLAEVVQNLLDNAARHAPSSPVLVRAGAELGNVVVRVEDRGPGVAPSEWETIFQRGRRGTTGSPGGSGLGLYVARRLMRDQGGDLWVEGRPGGGASFALYLPGFHVAPAPAGPPPAATSVSDPHPAGAAQHRV
jgi:signal transduction histidine kinase